MKQSLLSALLASVILLGCSVQKADQRHHSSNGPMQESPEDYKALKHLQLLTTGNDPWSCPVVSDPGEVQAHTSSLALLATSSDPMPTPALPPMPTPPPPSIPTLPPMPTPPLTPPSIPTPPPTPPNGTTITYNPPTEDWPTASPQACTNWLNDWNTNYGSGSIDWKILGSNPALKNLYYLIQNNCNFDISCSCFSESTGTLTHSGGGLYDLQQCKDNQARCDNGTPGLGRCQSDLMWVIPGPGMCGKLIKGSVGGAIVVGTVRQCGNRIVDH